MITVELKDEAVSAALARIAAALTDMTPVMQEIGEALVASTMDRFAAGVDPDGNPWAPKSATTMDAYRSRGDTVSFKPLWGPSGALATTIHSVAGADQVRIGSGQVYAGVMQFGAAQGAFGARAGRTRPTEKRPKSQDYFFHIPWGNIPARPFIGLSEADRTNIVDMIDEWLSGVANGERS